MSTVDALIVSPAMSLDEALRCIDASGKGIALVCDGERRLVGTVTDGDIRRAILARTDLATPISELFASRTEQPTTALIGTSQSELLRIMNELELRHVPIVDADRRLVDVALLSDIVRDFDLPVEAMVMAGGFGKRLHPLTESTPKPMLAVGDRPVLERIVDQLRGAGIRQVSFATHFLPEAISEHFGDGVEFGVDISYVHEQEPLGTAGALGLLAPGTEPVLVINGDIVTRIDLRAMVDFHQSHRADLTVAVRSEEVEVPYGVLALDGIHVRDIEEKPVIRHFASAGIYLIDTFARRLVRPNERLDMPDLIRATIAAGGTVVSFPLREYWIDIGRHEEYERAQRDAAESDHGGNGR